MSLYRIQLEPVSAFYAGAGSRASKSGAVVHSDTLHAALLAAGALTQSPLLDAPERIRISSVYPFWKDIYFCPRPFLPLPGPYTEDGVAGRKRWKSVRLVSERVLTAWLEGDQNLRDRTELIGGNAAVFADELRGKSAPPATLVLSELQPAATLDRRGGTTTPFQRRGLRVDTVVGCGLYFLADLDAVLLPEFEAALARLGELGLGGERSVGYGRFEVLSIEPLPALPIKAPSKPANAILTLSLYLPTRAEVEAGVLETPAAYDCALRGGWIHSLAGAESWKRSVRMCLEGSVLRRPPDVEPAGEVRDVRPESFTAHPVWRSGLAFAVPCHAEKEEHT